MISPYQIITKKTQATMTKSTTTKKNGEAFLSKFVG